MDDELFKVFVTMQADPDMKMRAWGNAVEELMVLIAQAIQESEWKETIVYGPDSGTFSFFPCICIEATLPAQVIVGLREAIDSNGWLTVPVNVYVVQGDKK